MSKTAMATAMWDTSSGTTHTITGGSTTTGTITLDNQSTVTITGDIIQSGTPEQPVKPKDYSYRDNHYDDEWGSWA